MVEGYEIEVTRLYPNETNTSVWASGIVATNRTQNIPWPTQSPGAGSCPELVSHADYAWRVRAYPGPSEWGQSVFSTALLDQAEWAPSQWIQSADREKYSAQMRREFVLPPGTIARARAYVALPGVGAVWINGRKVDGRAGTRSLSQYDVRALYHTYDVAHLVRPGQPNAIAVSVGVGWFGHPAKPIGNPPGSVRQPFGPPTLRLLLRVESARDTGGVQVTAVGTDTRWLESPGPVLFTDIYNGTVYDARLETPGWTAPGYPPAGAAGATWSPVLAGAEQPDFNLSTAILSAATFPPVAVIESRPAKSMRMTAPGVYVYDFGANLPGWCRIHVAGERGLTAQLRHAEVLQHPPYGPLDGTIYVANLRTATATDVYILAGDPDGETFDFSMSQHGFRYVELTFPGAPPSSQPPPSLNTVDAVYARSAVEQTGSLAV